MEEQVQLIRELTEIVRATQCFRNAARNGKLIRVPTGDGMALAFLSSPEEPVRCALEISTALQQCPGIQLRMGIHSGPVNRIVDVNEKTNIAGSGINVAQRVLDCADAGHILLSAHIAEDLAQVGHWRAYLHDLGVCEVKHGLRLHVFNLYKDGLGNPEIPDKLRKRKRKHGFDVTLRPIAAPRLPKLALVASLGSAVALLIGSLVLFYRTPLSSIMAPANWAKAGASAAIPEKSIAVLPFENLSGQQENVYFADGVQDEILTGLSKVADLKVISRTSTLQIQEHCQSQSARDREGARRRAHTGRVPSNAREIACA